MGPKLILVTGTTGYVGGRLVPRLLEAGYRVRCPGARPEPPARTSVAKSRGSRQRRRARGRHIERSHERRFGRVLPHPRQAGRTGGRRTRPAVARNFAEAASSMNIERIIYLGELVDPTTNLSPYLRARHETGYILRHSSVPVTEFRAGMIVGSGSVLFEMIRYLTEREPIAASARPGSSRRRSRSPSAMCCLSHRRAQDSRKRRPDDRDRRTDPPDLCRYAARIRKGTRAQTLPHPHCRSTRRASPPTGCTWSRPSTGASCCR
jgi:hypothetical protein